MNPWLRHALITLAVFLLAQAGAPFVWAQSEATPADGWTAVEEAVVQPGGIPDWWTWILLAVIILAFVLLFLGVMLFIVMREDRQKKDVEETLRKNKELEIELRDRLRQIEESSAKGTEPGIEDQETGHAPARTVVYAESALAVILKNHANKREHTLAVHKINGRSIDAPKYTIGRYRECDVCLVENGVSGKHCDIYADFQGNTFVFDLHSANGTSIRRGADTIRVKGEEALKDGDVLTLGNERLGGVAFDVAIKDVRNAGLEQAPEPPPALNAQAPSAADATRATLDGHPQGASDATINATNPAAADSSLTQATVAAGADRTQSTEADPDAQRTNA